MGICWHPWEGYFCPRCLLCCACKHRYEERSDGWWVKCKNGAWRRCYPAGKFIRT